jgi:sugar phosphate isomerase/epimerase
MAELGIENLSAFALPPVQFVELAADLGCRHISAGLTQLFYNPQGYPPFDLRADKALRREMVAAMADRGVSISLAEGFVFRPGAEARDMAGDLDVFHELGARRINMVSMDPDLPRTFDQYAILAEMAAERGFTMTTEFGPALSVGDIGAALDAVRHVGRPDFRLLLDTMHFARSGGDPAELAALDPDLIGYVQLSDATRGGRFDSYMEEAMFERMPPGAGELDVLAVVKALPKDRVFGLEVPQRGLAEAGVAPKERLVPVVSAARELLAQAGAL